MLDVVTGKLWICSTLMFLLVLILNFVLRHLRASAPVRLRIRNILVRVGKRSCFGD